MHAANAMCNRPCSTRLAACVQGMRGVVAFATEQEEALIREGIAANETWIAYPDDDPVRTSTSAADSRAALVPLLAHKV